MHFSKVYPGSGLTWAERVDIAQRSPALAAFMLTQVEFEARRAGDRLFADAAQLALDTMGDDFDSAFDELDALIEEANAPFHFDRDDWGNRADYARDMSMDNNVPAGAA